MKSLLLLLALAFVSCETTSKPSSGAASSSSNASGTEKYRYVNSLDFAKNNTLDPVKVIGYDEGNVGEATRLDVSVGDASISLKDDAGNENAMYNPGVELGADGALIVTWSQIGETSCRSEIVASASGKLVERKRTTK